MNTSRKVNEYCIYAPESKSPRDQPINYLACEEIPQVAQQAEDTQPDSKGESDGPIVDLHGKAPTRQHKPKSYPEEDVIAFLKSVEVNRTFGVTQHYQALGWNATKGTRVKNALVDGNLLFVTKVPSGYDKPKSVLSLTEKGREFLKTKSRTPSPT